MPSAPAFAKSEALAEVRTAWSYRDLSDEEFAWALDFVGRGGESLRAYPEYHRVVRDAEGVFRVRGPPYRAQAPHVGRDHRVRASMLVKMLNGRNLGTIEESFISRMRKGDAFVFGGRLLELVRSHEMTAYVQPARRRSGTVPRWSGGKMPLSTEMADASLRELEGRDGRPLRRTRDASWRGR